MLRTLEDYARSRFGALRLALAVRDYNLPARRCYAMAGFREHSCDGSLIRMHKIIGPAG
jgi:RimJ/RimL family protein N-acetyltransferase